MIDNPHVEDSGALAPREYANLAIRFVLGRGLVADSFPLTIAVSPEMIERARTHKGVIQVQGNGGLGTRITFDLQNGSAIYELTDRIQVIGSAFPYFAAERKAFKPRVAGKEVEIRTYGLADLGALADDWPALAAFREELVNPPANLSEVVRRKNWSSNPQVIFRVGNAKAIYAPFLRHQTDKGVVYISELVRLQTERQTIVRLPVAVAAGRPGLSLNY